MDPNYALLLVPAIIWIVSVAAGLLLLYGVIRVGVSRGMRDHYNWVERERTHLSIEPSRRESVGQYLGFTEGNPTAE